MRVAAKLLELAVALARDHEKERVPLVPDLGRSLEEIGELRRAQEILGEVADSSGDAPSRLAFLEVASLRDYTEATEASFAELREAPRRVPDSTPDVSARAAILEAEVRWTVGKYSEMNEFLVEARHASGQLPDGPDKRSILNSVLGWEARAILLGPEDAASGRVRCGEILEEARTSGSRALEATVLAVCAGLYAMLGEFGEARRLYKDSRRIGESFGLATWLAALPLYSGPVELLDDRAADAGRQLRRGHDALERMGERSRRATMAAFLAHALYEQQRDDQAEEFALRSKELGAEDDVFTKVTWRGALAKVLARRGEVEQAAVLARKAVAFAEETDGLNLRGDALLDLAEVLHVHDSPKARETAEQARALYENKGNVAATRRTNAFMARLPS